MIPRRRYLEKRSCRLCHERLYRNDEIADLGQHFFILQALARSSLDECVHIHVVDVLSWCRPRQSTASLHSCNDAGSHIRYVSTLDAVFLLRTQTCSHHLEAGDTKATLLHSLRISPIGLLSFATSTRRSTSFRESSLGLPPLSFASTIAPLRN